MGIAQLVSDCGKTADDGLAVAKNGFEYRLAVLAWSQVEAFCGNAIQLRQIVLGAVCATRFLNNMFADGFQQRFGRRDRTLRITNSAFQSFLPGGMNTVLIERAEGLGNQVIRWLGAGGRRVGGFVGRIARHLP